MTSLALFHTLVTASGHQISLTPLHLIPIVDQHDDLVYVAAKDVQVGDVLRVMSREGEMINSVVEGVKVEMKQGFYAPMTEAGTLLVNGVLSSCYANVRSHALAHWAMGVLRMYDAMVRSLWSSESVDMVDGLHMIPRVMHTMSSIFVPFLLRSS